MFLLPLPPCPYVFSCSRFLTPIKSNVAASESSVAHTHCVKPAVDHYVLALSLMSLSLM